MAEKDVFVGNGITPLILNFMHQSKSHSILFPTFIYGECPSTIKIYNGKERRTFEVGSQGGPDYETDAELHREQRYVCNYGLRYTTF